MTTTSPGRSRGQHLLHIGAKNFAVVAAATVMTAAMPPRLIAPKVVSTCQWPWGVASAIRSPFGARPHALVICVVTPLSSRKINFSGAMVPSFSANAARRCWFASVSRSRAWSDFFQTQPHLPEHRPQRGYAYPEMGLPAQLFLQLRQGEVRLLLQPASQPLANRLGEPRLAARPMGNTLHHPGASPLPMNLPHLIQTDAKALRQLRLRSFALLAGLQNPAPQIVRKRSCHSRLSGDLAALNLPSLLPLHYLLIWSRLCAAPVGALHSTAPKSCCCACCRAPLGWLPGASATA